MAEKKKVNQSGIISKAQAKKEVANIKQSPSPSSIMKSIVSNAATQELLRNSLKENAGAFTASLIDLYNTDKNLQECDPREVMSEALKAVSLKLPINKQMGFAYIIPFRDGKSGGKQRPQFQLGYKGYIQLCMRSGVYKYINAGPVYEGELVSTDKLTGEIDLSREAISDKIIGYFAFIETLNGFRKTFYWPIEKVRKHATRYSKSYKAGNNIWKDNFDEMAVKTVLRNLLSHYGLLSVELQSAFSAEIVDMADEAQDTDEIDTSDTIDVTYNVEEETVNTELIPEEKENLPWKE